METIRGDHRYIDEESLLNWSDPSSEEEIAEELDENYDDDRVEDEDWENAERDFTKQYNRLRRHVAVRTGDAQGVASSTNHSNSVAALPALNHPRNATASSTPQRDKTTDQLAALSKYSSRISKIDTPYAMGVGVNRKGPSASANLKDKSDRATNEQVLDPRTRIILFKMIGRGLINEVNGCVSTGKEANVYHALSPDQKHLALKIYKTSILTFKDRDKYVTGEYRFRRGYSRRNPRKMVRLWAEKEMRNLKRLVAANVPCPEPVEVRENVLVMAFLGDGDGWASPRLKDAEIPSSACASLYSEMVLTVRKMYHQCKLVHADLSEYNILYHNSHLYIIDVSQSVERDHPSAFEFLRKDIKNIEDFFGRLGVKTLGLRRGFEFIVSEDHGDEQGVLEQWLRQEEAVSLDDAVSADSAEHDKLAAAHEDSIFLQSYIPRSLNEVFDPERDVAIIKRGEVKKLIYADTIGLLDTRQPKITQGEHVQSRNNVHFEDDDNACSSNSSEEERVEDSVSSDSLEGREDGQDTHQPRGHRHEDRDAKKERKKAVKEEAREKRKNKIPKSEKKRRIKVTSHSTK